MPTLRNMQTFIASRFSRQLTAAFCVVIGVVALAIPIALVQLQQLSNTRAQLAADAGALASVAALERSIGDVRTDVWQVATSDSAVANAQLRTDLDALAAHGKTLERGASAQEAATWSDIYNAAYRTTGEFNAQRSGGDARAAAERFDEAYASAVQAPAEAAAQVLRQRAQAQADSGDATTSRARLMLLALLLASVLGAAALAVVLPRRLMSRLRQLGEAVHRVALGDLEVAVPAAAGRDEVGVLIDDFNRMVMAMRWREEDYRRKARDLDARVRAEQERANNDPLTGLRNHSYFQDALAMEIERCQRSGGRVTVAVIDLDNFKQVNDRFGHHEGDEVLRRVTEALRKNVRPYDLPARLGGEEFGIILPDTTAEEALVSMQRIANAVLPCGPSGEPATFSAGMATYPDHARTQAELFQHADEAAYTAKSRGKDQVVIYSPFDVVAMDSSEREKQRSRDAVLATARTLAASVDAKDPYGGDHSKRTAMYAATLARAAGLDEETVRDIHTAAQLHDIGKIGIDESIIAKPGRLTEAEFAEVRQHPELSYRILENADVGPIAQWVLHHHEHWDGSGYPHGLSGTEIPTGARIVLIADAFDAMTSDRAYRRALRVDQALKELGDNAGSQFDPELTRLFIALVSEGHIAPPAPEPEWYRPPDAA